MKENVCSFNEHLSLYEENCPMTYFLVWIHKHVSLGHGIGSSKLFTEFQEQFDPTLNTTEHLSHSNPSHMRDKNST